MYRLRVVLTVIGVLIVLVLCLAPPAGALTSAGGPFVWQSPQPFGWGLTQLTFADATQAWAVVDQNGRLARSDDAGLTWTIVQTGVRGDVWSLEFTDALHGRATITDQSSQHQALLVTDDGGASWATRELPVGLYGATATFIDGDQGWVLGRRDLGDHFPGVSYRTADGGQTWSAPTALPADGWVNEAKAVDVDHLWVQRGGRWVMVSADGGSTWTSRPLPPHAWFDALCPVGPDSAWAIVYGGPWPRRTLVYTSDGAATWTKVTVLPTYATASLTATDHGEVFLSCDSWETPGSFWVQRSSDAGATWAKTYVGPESPGLLVLSPDGSTILGQGGGLWRSVDAGATWTQLQKGTDGRSLADVAATPTNGVWAAGGVNLAPGDYDSGGFGLLLHAADGVTWEAQPLPLGEYLSTITFTDDLHGWAAGGRRLVRTTDGGSSWQKVDADPGLELYDVAAAGPSNVVAIGYDASTDAEDAEIAWTTDAGATWGVFMLTTGEWLNNVAILGEGHYLVASSRWVNGVERLRLLETTDGGATWSARRIALGLVPRDIDFVDELHGWILASEPAFFVGESGPASLLRTSDGGQTWQKSELLPDASLAAITFEDDQHGWAVGDRVLATDDGGGTWHADGGDVGIIGWRYESARLSAVAQQGGNVWAVGPLDTIISTVDTAADTAPPVTTDDGDRLWHNDDVTLQMHGYDASGGAAVVTQYKIDGAKDWTTGDQLYFGAPIDHVGDGKHWVTYRSIDETGNVETARRCPIMIDTVPPETSIACGRSVPRGSTVDVKVRFFDELSPYGRVTLMLGRWQGGGFKAVKTIRLGLVPRNQATTVHLRYNVPAGHYLLIAPATDLAGNEGGWGQHSVHVR